MNISNSPEQKRLERIRKETINTDLTIFKLLKKYGVSFNRLEEYVLTNSRYFMYENLGDVVFERMLNINTYEVKCEAILNLKCHNNTEFNQVFIGMSKLIMLHTKYNESKEAVVAYGLVDPNDKTELENWINAYFNLYFDIDEMYLPQENLKHLNKEEKFIYILDNKEKNEQIKVPKSEFKNQFEFLELYIDVQDRLYS